MRKPSAQTSNAAPATATSRDPNYGKSIFLNRSKPMGKSMSVLPFAPERLSVSDQKTAAAEVKMALENLAKTMGKTQGRSERTRKESATNTVVATVRFRKVLQRTRAGRVIQKLNKSDETQAIMERHAKVLDRYKIRRVDVDESDQNKAPSLGLLMVNPHGTLYKFWQLVTLILIVYQTLALPYTLAFTANDSTVFDLVTNGIFAMDIIIQFNMPILIDDDTSEYITNRCQIAKHYAMGWLFFDILACLPFDTIIMLTSDTTKSGKTNLNMLGLLKALRIPRLLRLFRVLRLVKLLKISQELRRWLQYSRYANLLKLVRLVLTFLLMCHMLACIWAGAVVSEQTFGVVSHASSRFQYLSSFFTSLLLVMGQNITLNTEKEYFFSILVLLLGAGLMATVFGNVAILIANFYENQSNYQRKMEWLFASMNRMKLPNDLQNRINDYYQTMWEKHGTLDGAVASFIPELSRNLAYEVELFLRMDMINRAPIFQNCSAKVVQELVMELELQVYMPGDYVVVRGEVGNDMYFVQSGICEVTKDVAGSASNLHAADADKRKNQRKEYVIKILAQGDYFGEIALLMNCKRTANVRAQVFSELCALTRETFECISVRYLEDRSIIEKFIMDKYDPGLLQAAMKQSAELTRRSSAPLGNPTDELPVVSTGGGVASGGAGGGSGGDKHPFYDVLKGIDERLVRIEEFFSDEPLQEHPKLHESSSPAGPPLVYPRILNAMNLGATQQPNQPHAGGDLNVKATEGAGSLPPSEEIPRQPRTLQRHQSVVDPTVDTRGSLRKIRALLGDEEPSPKPEARRKSVTDAPYTKPSLIRGVTTALANVLPRRLSLVLSPNSVETMTTPFAPESIDSTREALDAAQIVHGTDLLAGEELVDTAAANSPLDVTTEAITREDLPKIRALLGEDARVGLDIRKRSSRGSSVRNSLKLNKSRRTSTSSVSSVGVGVGGDDDDDSDFIPVTMMDGVLTAAEARKSLLVTHQSLTAKSMVNLAALARREEMGVSGTLDTV